MLRVMLYVSQRTNLRFLEELVKAATPQYTFVWGFVFHSHESFTFNKVFEGLKPHILIFDEITYGNMIEAKNLDPHVGIIVEVTQGERPSNREIESIKDCTGRGVDSQYSCSVQSMGGLIEDCMKKHPDYARNYAQNEEATK